MGNSGKCKRSMQLSESVWWNNEIKAAIRRKEAAWKRVVGS